MPQGYLIEQAQREIDVLLGFIAIIDLDDVWVVECANDLSLALEALHECGAILRHDGQHLQGDFARVELIIGPEDPGSGAFA